MSRALAALVAWAALAHGQEEPRPVFPACVEQVTVDVVVVDREGEPVKGLGRSDFTLLEDGVRQEIAAFEAVDVGAPPEAPAAGEEPESARARVVGADAPPPPVRVFVIVFDDLHLDATDAPRAVPRSKASWTASPRETG